jgi:hypothetical protein
MAKWLKITTRRNSTDRNCSDGQWCYPDKDEIRIWYIGAWRDIECGGALFECFMQHYPNVEEVGIYVNTFDLEKNEIRPRFMLHNKKVTSVSIEQYHAIEGFGEF